MFQVHEIRKISKALKVYLGTYYARCISLEKKIENSKKEGKSTLEFENNLKVAQTNLQEIKEIRQKVIDALQKLEPKT